MVVLKGSIRYRLIHNLALWLLLYVVINLVGSLPKPEALRQLAWGKRGSCAPPQDQTGHGRTLTRVPEFFDDGGILNWISLQIRWHWITKIGVDYNSPYLVLSVPSRGAGTLISVRNSRIRLLGWREHASLTPG